MGYAHEVTFKIKLAVIQTRVFFTLKRNTDTCVLIGTHSQSPGFIYQTTDVSAFASAVASDYIQLFDK